MIPLRDNEPSATRPIVNWTMIGLCALAFAFELSLGEGGLDDLIHRYALIPARFATRLEHAGVISWVAWQPVLSSMFLHGGLMHFASNMIFLWIFGDNVEDRFGHLGYALFYVAGGTLAGLAHVASNAGSTIPTVGASGAIAAVMGAYLVLHPGARIQTLIWFGFFVQVVAVPAILWLGLWFALQLMQGVANSGLADQGGVAWWAHAGGFVFGALAVALLGRNSPGRARAGRVDA